MPETKITVPFDPADKAKYILQEHCASVMQCVYQEFSSNEEMYECMVSECAFILVTDFIEGKYTPMQYNAVRNELAKLLWGIFEPYVEAEWNKADEKFHESLQ